jgi:uncharacterized Zn-binding protein involved in type VI secretion
MPGKPAAKQGDMITTTCMHQVQGQPPGTAPPVVAPMPHPFAGPFTLNLSRTVKINGVSAAVKGSRANNSSPHIPIPPPGTAPIMFMKPPDNQAEIVLGSMTVKFDGQPAARIGDPVRTCSEIPPTGPHGSVSPGPGVPVRVFIGG